MTQTLTAEAVSQIAQQGLAALKRGDAESAAVEFTKLYDAGVADVSIHYAMALALQQLGKHDEALKFADQAILKEPASLPLLIFKADLLYANQDKSGASAYYLAAVKLAERDIGLATSAALKSEIARAKSMCDTISAALAQEINARLSAIPVSDRLLESLDILFGRAAPYPQAPRFFHFPGLIAQPFFDTAAFDWVTALEQSTDAIAAELALLLRDHHAFKPYLASSAARPPLTQRTQNAQNPMLDNPDWSAFYLWKNGVLQDENARRCPATVAAMANVPFTQLPNRSPTVLFSMLRPGAHIPAHNGLINTRLIVHLPLIVPGQCRFRVGNHTREWQRGKVWLFDDTIEHEAWNDSDQTRVILIFEVDRPDMTAEELAGVREIFAALDSHRKQQPEWEI